MFRDELMCAARAFDLAFDDRQAAQFERFYRLVVDWNERMNLTAITAPRDFAIKHVIDSLSIIRAEPALDGLSVIDVGTGAGFPGIPLKIFCPTIRLTLLDSLNKRIKFLSTAVEELGLDGVECIHARAEDAAHSELREKFDVAVARAVARLNVLTEYCLPFVARGGKSRAPLKIELPNGDPRSIVVIEKCASTPKKFPRKSGTPDKKPILLAEKK